MISFIKIIVLLQNNSNTFRKMKILLKRWRPLDTWMIEVKVRYDTWCPLLAELKI